MPTLKHGHKRPSVPFITYSEFKRHGILAVTSLADGDNNLALHTGADTGQALLNRVNLFRQFGFGLKDTVFLNQMHGDEVVIARNFDRGQGADSHRTAITGDAVITAEPDLAIVILTADCLPVLALDTKKKVIGLVHSGWKGAQKGILRKTLELMRKEFGCDPKNMVLTNGPFIGPCCYEVSEDFRDNFPKKYFIRKRGKHFFDLYSATMDQALESGVPRKNIRKRDFCTVCDKGYFSNRADRTKSRMATVLAIVK